MLRILRATTSSRPRRRALPVANVHHKPLLGFSQRPLHLRVTNERQGNFCSAKSNQHPVKGYFSRSHNSWQPQPSTDFRAFSNGSDLEDSHDDDEHDFEGVDGESSPPETQSQPSTTKDDILSAIRQDLPQLVDEILSTTQRREDEQRERERQARLESELDNLDDDNTPKRYRLFHLEDDDEENAQPTITDRFENAMEQKKEHRKHFTKRPLPEKSDFTLAEDDEPVDWGRFLLGKADDGEGSKQSGDLQLKTGVGYNNHNVMDSKGSSSSMQILSSMDDGDERDQFWANFFTDDGDAPSSTPESDIGGVDVLTETTTSSMATDIIDVPDQPLFGVDSKIDHESGKATFLGTSAGTGEDHPNDREQPHFGTDSTGESSLFPQAGARKNTSIDQGWSSFGTDSDVNTGNRSGVDDDTEEDKLDTLRKGLALLSVMSSAHWELFDITRHQAPSSLELIHDQDGSEHKALDNFPANSDLADIERVRTMLEEVENGTISLTTEDYNVLLMRVATSTKVAVDDVFATLLEIYQQMMGVVAPDTTTYEILLLVLDRRENARNGSNSGIVLTLLQDMIDFEVPPTSDVLLQQCIQCCERESNLNVAKRLVFDYALAALETGKPCQLSAKVLATMMRMLAREDDRESALLLLRKCISFKMLFDEHRTVDKVFNEAIRWPDRSRSGRRRDISAFLEDLLEVMDESTGTYKPGYLVKRSMIFALARLAKLDSARWLLLERPFLNLLDDRYTSFHPDRALLETGMMYCEVSKDSRLACALVKWGSEKHAVPNGNSTVFSFGEQNVSLFSSSISGSETSLSEDSKDSGSLFAGALFPPILEETKTSFSLFGDLDEPFINDDKKSGDAFQSAEDIFDAPKRDVEKNLDIAKLSKSNDKDEEVKDEEVSSSEQQSRSPELLMKQTEPFQALNERDDTSSHLFDFESGVSDEEESGDEGARIENNLGSFGVAVDLGDSADDTVEETETHFGDDAEVDLLGLGDSNSSAQVNASKNGDGFHSVMTPSFRLFERSVNVCLAAQDYTSCREILDHLACLDHVYPPMVQSAVWRNALKGFAKGSGDFDAVKQIFDDMKSKNMVTGEDCYGALIQGYVVANQPAEAQQVFDDMKSQLFGDGIEPGLACYNAIILSHLRAKRWENVPRVYQQMKDAGFNPDSTAIQGLLISAFKSGGPDAMQPVLEDVLATDGEISAQNCSLAIKTLLPDIVNGASTTNDNIQKQLRAYADANYLIKEETINLLRSVRKAQMEQNRAVSTHVTPKDISQRRREAWKDALRDLVAFLHARNASQNRAKVA